MSDLILSQISLSWVSSFSGAGQKRQSTRLQLNSRSEPENSPVFDDVDRSRQEETSFHCTIGIGRLWSLVLSLHGSTAIAAPVKFYMFGYWGWGSSTEQLLESVDAVERLRGFGPPVFVDIRALRSGRAKGFVKDAFKATVGTDRYLWMSDLGNQAVLPGSTSKKRIQIRSPKAAIELLELSQQLAKDNQHLIYFCACEFPRFCHRYAVALLLLKAAHSKGVALEVVEWPGDEPSSTPVELEIPNQRNSQAKRLSLGVIKSIGAYAGLPFGATVRVVRGAEKKRVPVAPVRYAPTGWYLPILQGDDGAETPATKRAIAVWRKRRGYTRLFATLKTGK